MSGTYKIGTINDGVNNLIDMSVVTGYDPHPTEFLEYSEVVGQTLSGAPIEAGNPTVKWTWGLLDQSAFNRLYAYCTGAWSRVYIQTRVNSGTGYNYGIFKATMARPRARTVPGLYRSEVEVVFTSLETP